MPNPFKVFILVSSLILFISCGPSVDPEFLGAEAIQITKADNQSIKMRTRLIFESLDGGKAVVEELEMTPYINGIALPRRSLMFPIDFSLAPKRHRQFIIFELPNHAVYETKDSVIHKLFNPSPLGKKVEVMIKGHARLVVSGKAFDIPYKYKKELTISRPRRSLESDFDYRNADNEFHQRFR